MSPAHSPAPAWLAELAPRIRIVFCDLDDTLLDEHHEVPARTAQVVRRLHRCGVRFSPATGRTVPALRRLFGPLADEIDYVAGNGTDVLVDGRTIYHEPYPREAALQLFDAVRASQQHMGFVTFDEAGPHMASVEADFVRAHVESLRNAPTCPDELLFAGAELGHMGFVTFDEAGPHMASVEADFVRAHVESLRNAPTCPDELLFAGAELGKVGVVAPEGAAAAVRELEQAVGDLFSFAPTGPYWIDVLVKGVDKARGIERMLEYLGLAPDEALAFGDSMNDVAMMELLPNTVAVSNAMPELKQLCAHTIGSNLLAPDEALAFGDSMNDVAMMELLPNTVAVSNAMPELKQLCAHTIGSNLDEAVLDCLDQLCGLQEQAR